MAVQTKAKAVEWLEDRRIAVPPPHKPLKITGTRFASILGFNPFSSPFQAWCEITRTYKEPFEGNVHTVAGQTIEPKVQDYLKELYFDDLVVPEDVFGPDPYKTTFGDFYKAHPYLGGMWDAKVPSERMVLEIKTTLSAEKWLEGAPVYQALQGALYAYLEGWETVGMVGVFLTPEELQNPQAFVPNSSNVTLDVFDIHERFPHFDEWLERAHVFSRDSVQAGISPIYDEKTDKDFLKALRTLNPEPSDDTDSLLDEAAALIEQIQQIIAPAKALEKRLKEVEGAIKTTLAEQLCQSPDATYAALENPKLVYTLTKGVTEKINKEAMELDGIYNDYIQTEETYTLRKKIIKE